MFKETLASAQPIVYQTLSHALTSRQLSHCYLFCGPKGTLKRPAAVLLAQSLVCETPGADGFGCEQCLNCIRVNDGNYFDVIMIDGTSQLIKMESIASLQQQFEKTALEKAGKKVFIIDGCDNMVAKAANSLLKFIEEPSTNMTGIFITTHADRMLPTIVSRCQVLNFKPLSKQAFYEEAKRQQLDELNCHLLARLVHEMDDIALVKDQPSYTMAVQYFVEFMNYYFSDFSMGIYYLQSAGFKSAGSAKTADRQCLGYFLDIATEFVHDYTNHVKIGDDSWDGLLEKAAGQPLDAELFLQAVTKTKDAVANSNANTLLLVDAMLYELSGGSH